MTIHPSPCVDRRGRNRPVAIPVWSVLFYLRWAYQGLGLVK